MHEGYPVRQNKNKTDELLHNCGSQFPPVQRREEFVRLLEIEGVTNPSIVNSLKPLGSISRTKIEYRFISTGFENRLLQAVLKPS